MIINARSYRRSRHAKAIWGTLLLCIGGAHDASAQGWEYIFGAGCVETGYGIAKVVTCTSGAPGYITVGRSNTPNTSSSAPCGTPTVTFDSYVAYIPQAGAPPLGLGLPWSNTYDLSGGVGNDEAYAVVENATGTGFYVVGTTDEPAGTGGRDAYIMEIDCNGNYVWSQTYGFPGTIEEGRDILLAANGNGMLPWNSQPGDLVVAGWGFTYGSQDGILFRTDPVGNLRWNSSYDGGAIDYFRSITESVNAMSPNAGDIIAAGGTTSFGNALQGLAYRIDGNNGMVTIAAVHGAADYGGTANESFNGVIEAQIGASPDLVFAGFSTAVSGPHDVYIVKTNPNPCFFITQTVIASPAVADRDIAFDLVESSGHPICPVGGYALTGQTNAGAAGPEMFLMTVTPGLGFIRGFTYGDLVAPGTGAGTEIGHGIVEDGGGFAMTGFTTSNMNFNPVPDPEDVYLVRTDGFGSTTNMFAPPGCQTSWFPMNVLWPVWIPSCWTFTTNMPIASIANSATTQPENIWNRVCPRAPCIIRLPDNRGNGNDGGSRTSGAGSLSDAAGAIHAYPNPIRKGGDMTLEFVPGSNGPITVRVMNVLGQIVDVNSSDNMGGRASFAFKTEELPAGTYVIEISDGTKTQTARVIVTD